MSRLNKIIVSSVNRTNTVDNENEGKIENNEYFSHNPQSHAEGENSNPHPEQGFHHQTYKQNKLAPLKSTSKVYSN